LIAAAIAAVSSALALIRFISLAAIVLVSVRGVVLNLSALIVASMWLRVNSGNVVSGKILGGA
jgi:hypothetical protein